MTRAIIRIGATFSNKAAAIIYNAHSSAEQHTRFGYSGRNAVVIPNGFDAEQFKPRPSARVELCNRLDIPQDSLLIGHIGRHHPMKGQLIYLKAAGVFSKEVPSARFILAGRDVGPENGELLEAVGREEIADRTSLLGEQRDIESVSAGLDIFTSSSLWGEGFSNAIGEACACGVPCVVSDVGDSALIVGDFGEVVPPGDPGALAAAWSRLYTMGASARAELGEKARQRIVSEYSIEGVAAKYRTLYEELGRPR